ncbi:hypothetical protein ACFSRY_04825 [Pontibacter locisalis]|uniref:Uncharacterized protein n=1 Tax=Pontibacter locisalis TaxID=1719035 RepID=A0ABW5IIE8_9BACT
MFLSKEQRITLLDIKEKLYQTMIELEVQEMLLVESSARAAKHAFDLAG